MARLPEVDPRKAIEWLQLHIRSKGLWTLGALHPSGIPPVTLTTSDPEEAFNFVDHFVDTHNIHFNPNPARPEVRRDKKLGKADVERAMFIPADFDRTEDGQRLVLVPGAKEKMIKRLQSGEIGPGRPSIILDSGNGIQALWQLDDEANLDNPRARDEVEGFGRYIADNHGGDHCWTVNHLFRLPFTMNWPNAKKLSEGLQPVPTRPIEATGQLYEQWRFDWDGVYASDFAIKLGAAETFDSIDDLVDKYYLPDRLIAKLTSTERFDSDAEWALLKDLLKAGLPPEALMGVMLHEDWGVGARAREQHQKGVRDIGDYLNYTIPRVVEAVGIDRAKTNEDFGELDERWDSTEEGSEDSSTEKPKAKKFRFTLKGPVNPAELQRPTWLIKNIIQQHKVGALYGGPKTGKTFLSLDMACCVAMGIPFHGFRVTQGRVLYIAAEGDEYSINERIYAWCQVNDVSIDALSERLQIVYSTVHINDEATLREFFLNVRAQAGIHWDLVFVDTLTKNMRGDQNSQEVMGTFFEHVHVMRRVMNAAILIVHHSDKAGNNYRGSSVIEGDVDFMLALKKAERTEKEGDRKLSDIYAAPIKDLRIMELPAARESEDGGQTVLHFKRFLLGTDEDGDERTTRYFERAAVKSGYQNESSSGGRTEADMGKDDRAGDGKFAPLVDMKGLLLEIFASPPKTIKDLIDEEVAGRSRRNVYRLVSELRAAKLLSKKGFVVTDNGKSFLGEKAMMDVLSTETEQAE